MRINMKGSDKMAQINGETISINNISIYDYLKKEGYQLEKVVVEKNLEIIPRDQWKSNMIQHEDTIEVLSFVGGG